MRRRDFVTVLGGMAPQSKARLAGFLQGLEELGWTVGRNVQIDSRWGSMDADQISKYAAELVALAPDVILASGTSTMTPLLRVTRTVPIVFTNLGDPVGSG
jgi:putative ABC transport system substrate-binding protein